jgi:hypothetical protein
VFSWDTSLLAAGSRHTLRAVAADQAGNSSSVSITVTVLAIDTTPPQVRFVNPEDGDSLRGDVRINVGASDNVAVTRVEVYIDNQLFATLTRAPYTVNWRTANAAKGNHTLMCIGFDAAGNNATTSITVNIR